jgi:hypothetical protein
MPFKLGKITASKLEDFKACEDGLVYLNGLIQILNGAHHEVHINTSIGGLEITPTWYDLKSLRVMENPEINWVDYEHEKQCIWINTKKAIFKINLKKDDRNA